MGYDWERFETKEDLYDTPELRTYDEWPVWLLRLAIFGIVMFACVAYGRHLLRGLTIERSRSAIQLPLMDLHEAEKAAAALGPQLRGAAIDLLRTTLEARGEKPGGLIAARWIPVGTGPAPQLASTWHVQATFHRVDEQGTCTIDRDIAIEGSVVSDAEDRRLQLMTHKYSPLPDTPPGATEEDS